jgi:predicted MFS family arabinose efflux permease
MLVNFLHSFYGIGVTLSPYLMSLALDGADDWRKGFFIVFFIQLGITLLAFASLPIWKKIGERQAAEEEAPQTLSIRSMLKNPAILCLGIVFLASCGVELVSGTWCSTYFVSVKQVSPDDAALITSVFYIGMSLGRLVAGFVSRKWSATKIVFVASAIVVGSLVAIGVGQIAPLPLWSIILAVLFLGFGVGPSFASLTLLIPEKFGRSVSQSIIGLQMSMAYVGIAALPPIFGLLVEWIGAWLYPVYLIVLMACYVVSFVVFLRLPKKIKTVNEEV